jgi:hypothetical protein
MLRRFFVPSAILSLILFAISTLLLPCSFIYQVSASARQIEPNPSGPVPNGQAVQVYRNVSIVSGRILIGKTRRPTTLLVQWGWSVQVRPSEGTRWPIGVLGFWFDGLGTNSTIVLIPLWSIMAITAPLPIYWLHVYRRRKRRGFAVIAIAALPNSSQNPN